MIVEEYIKHASELGASDVHVVAGLPPKCRKDGQLIDLFPEILTHDTCEKIASELAGKLYSKIEDLSLIHISEPTRPN